MTVDEQYVVLFFYTFRPIKKIRPQPNHLHGLHSGLPHQSQIGGHESVAGETLVGQHLRQFQIVRNHRRQRVRRPTEGDGSDGELVSSRRHPLDDIHQVVQGGKVRVRPRGGNLCRSIGKGQ